MPNRKSQDVKFQLHTWSQLLEGRIALQKVVSASRELERASREENGGEIGRSDPATIKSVNKLLKCLLRLRDTYRNKSQLTPANHKQQDAVEDLQEDTDEENDDEDADNDNNDQGQDVTDELLDKRSQEYVKVRDQIIDKWCEKTKVGTIPKRGYTAMDVPTLQLISTALRNKERLITRTQIDRTSQVENDTNPEIFNDDDFYHHLLKEVISKDEGRKWVELQRLKYKIKRKTDTKATKGRKIKKDLIPKLVNFMAASKPLETFPEQIRDELMKSLFGRSVVSS